MKTSYNIIIDRLVIRNFENDMIDLELLHWRVTNEINKLLNGETMSDHYPVNKKEIPGGKKPTQKTIPMDNIIVRDLAANIFHVLQTNELISYK